MQTKEGGGATSTQNVFSLAINKENYFLLLSYNLAKWTVSLVENVWSLFYMFIAILSICSCQYMKQQQYVLSLGDLIDPDLQIVLYHECVDF